MAHTRGQAVAAMIGSIDQEARFRQRGQTLAITPSMLPRAMGQL